MAPATVWGRVRTRLQVSAWVIDANDGIIATAGLLQGFGGAGAGDTLLLFAASAATIAGGLSAGGAKWAEVAAQRERELELAEEEKVEIATNPGEELARLAEHWQSRGLTLELAREVAAQLSAKDALAASWMPTTGWRKSPRAPHRCWQASSPRSPSWPAPGSRWR